jgi:hypothetical protein
MTRPEPTADRPRAADALGVPPDAPPEAARAAFLRRLAADRWVPPEAAVAAVNRLAGAALPLTADAADEDAAPFRAEVEAFAAGYWDLPPADRRAKWDDLSARCPDGPDAARLGQLEPGLDVAVVAHDDRLVDEIAGVVRELFVLPPRDRAVRRAGWLAENAGRFPLLAAVARRLDLARSEVAELDPRLFEWFADKTSLAPVPEVATQTPADEADAIRRGTDDFRERQAKPHRNLSERTETAANKAVTGGGLGCGGLLVVYLIIKVLIALVGSSTRESPKPPSTYQPPYRAPYIPPASEPMTYNPRQIEEFGRYAVEGKGPEPPGYLNYLLKIGALKYHTKDGKKTEVIDPPWVTPPGKSKAGGGR